MKYIFWMAFLMIIGVAALFVFPLVLVAVSQPGCF